MNKFFCIILFVLCILNAEAKEKKLLKGQVDLKTVFETPVAGDKKPHNLYLEVGLDSSFALKKFLTINVDWLLYQPQEIKKNSYFNNQGIILKNLYLKFHNDDAEFYLGKVSPIFAYAWHNDNDNGNFYDEFSNDYAIAQKLGAGLKIKLNLEDLGNHNIDLSSFYNDDTGLSKSIITRRDIRNDRVGNSANKPFSSYAINYSAKDFFNLPSLFYNISYRNIKSNLDNIKDESGFAVGVGSNLEISEDFSIKTYLEYINIENFNSVNDRYNLEFDLIDRLPSDYQYLLFLLSLKYKFWHIGYNNQQRNIDNSIETKETSEEFSLKYRFKNGIYILGSRQEITGETKKSTIAGFVLGFKSEF